MTTSTDELHEQSDEAAARGDFWAALRYAGEIVRVSPFDHRARVKVGLSLGALGESASAVKILLVAAEQLVQDGFVLSAISVGRVALELEAEHGAVVEFLRRAHGVIAGLPAMQRAKVAPRAPPFRQIEDEAAGVLRLPDQGAVLTVVVAVAGSRPDPRPVPAVDGAWEPIAGARSVRAVPLMSDLSTEAFVALVERLNYLRLGPSEVVIEEGAPGTALYILLQGEVEVVTSQGMGHNSSQSTSPSEATLGSEAAQGVGRPLARLGPGTLFGELSLITRRPRSATVRTTQASELFEIDRATIESVASAHPSVLEEITAFARQRLVMNALASAPLFASLEDVQRHGLLSLFETKVFEAGARVIREGEPPAGLYVVVEGSFEVSTPDAEGDRVILAYLGVGQVFGEISLLDSRPTTAEVRAVEAGAVLYLPVTSFRTFIDGQPRLAEYLASLSEARIAEKESARSGAGVVVEVDDMILL